MGVTQTDPPHPTDGRPSVARGAPDRKAHIRVERTRRFMVAQSTLLTLAVFVVSAAGAAGAMDTTAFQQSVGFCVVMAVLTLAGWSWWMTSKRLLALVLTLLYVDSVLGLLFFYVAGKFETPAPGILTLCIAMAPLFAGRRHAWRLAAAQVLGYGALLALRQYGLFGDLLPYGYMLDVPAVRTPGFAMECLSNFTIAAFGMAYVAGHASVDNMKTQAELADEVAAKTQALEEQRRELEATNRRLASSNHEHAELNTRLRESHARLDQFNATVSHDLKAPLQTLMGRAEMIAMAGMQNPERAVHLAEEIADAAERMGRQIDELLKLSRLGERLGELEPVPLGESVSIAGSDLDHRLRTAGAHLEVVHPLPTAWGNSALLRELFQNLIENAVKYGAPSGANIRVSPAVAEPGTVAVAVEDDGSGIPAEERARVFGLFKRMEDHHHREGVGAGLAIVRRIVEVHGGSISIEDGLVLPGARFVVTLPSPTGAVHLAEGLEAVH